MVRSASSRVSNHEARGPSFETPRKDARLLRMRTDKEPARGALAAEAAFLDAAERRTKRSWFVQAAPLI
jgi:hypothetical protein